MAAHFLHTPHAPLTACPQRRVLLPRDPALCALHPQRAERHRRDRPVGVCVCCFLCVCVGGVGGGVGAGGRALCAFCRALRARSSLLLRRCSAQGRALPGASVGRRCGTRPPCCSWPPTWRRSLTARSLQGGAVSAGPRPARAPGGGRRAALCGDAPGHRGAALLHQGGS